MPSQFSQFFRKNGGSSSAEPASNEDLECGHESSKPQTPTASGYQSSPSRVYLPEMRTVHTSTVPQTQTRSREFLPLVQDNGQYGLTAPLRFEPRGSSKVMGHPARTICNLSSPFLSPTSRSPISPFDSNKHGQALRRLETNGSLKTIPCSQEEGLALNRTSFSWSEVGRQLFEEDDAVGNQGSMFQEPKIRNWTDDETVNQESGAGLPAPLNPPLSNVSCPLAVLSQRVSSKVVTLPGPPTIRARQSDREALPSFVFPLPNAEAKISEGMLENDTIRSIGLSQASKENEDVFAYEAEEEEIQQRSTGALTKCAHRAHDFVQGPDFEEINQYLWSPAPSDDGQEVPPTINAPVLHSAASIALPTSPISGIPSGFSGGFSPSFDSYGKDQFQSRSSSLGIPRVADSLLPHIDVLIPAGTIDLDSHSDFLPPSQPASTERSREFSDIVFRYSGLITDGAVSRPMSETELEQEVFHSLGHRVETRFNQPSSRDSISQGDRHTPNTDQIRGEHQPNVRLEMFPLDLNQKPSADSGPGSSQTSSSLSIHRYGRDPSGYKARFDDHRLPSVRTRCPTPPLLFGKNAIRDPERSDAKLKLALGNGYCRFEPNEEAIRVQDSRRLPTALCNLGEQDWETVSAHTEAGTLSFDRIAFETKTGSSLADTSDSGSLSLSKEAIPAVQQLVLPRQNYSFMLLKNSQTGELVQVPQYQDALGRGCSTSNNASAQLVSRQRAYSTYQHPSPLRIEHRHPFTSSLAMTSSLKLSALDFHDSHIVMQQNRLNSDLSSLQQSESIQEVTKSQAWNPLYKTPQDMSKIHKHMVDYEHTIKSKEQSRQSSPWLSTVSEVSSSDPSLPMSGGTFTKIVAGDGNRNVNVIAGLIGNRDVESSLANASSPSANFSSKPAPLTSLSIRISDTPPPSVAQGFHTETFQDDLDLGSQQRLGDFQISFTPSFNHEDLATSKGKMKNRSRSHSASRLQMEHHKPSPRRRRSSSESHSRLMASHSTPSARESSSSNSRGQQAPRYSLSLRHPFPLSDENDSFTNPSYHLVVQQRGRQPQAEGTSFDEPSTLSSVASQPLVSSSISSLPFVRNGILHTDLSPPTFDHPVYGRDRPWGRLRPGHPYPGLCPVPRGRPLFQRPVARAESPHLHRIPHQPTTELLERHVLLSQIYLILSMVIPPVALVYGHGYMDGVMRFHTVGQIDAFRNTEKTIALYWGYGVSAICMLVIIIVIIAISASG